MFKLTFKTKSTSIEGKDVIYNYPLGEAENIGELEELANNCIEEGINKWGIGLDMAKPRVYENAIKTEDEKNLKNTFTSHTGKG